MPGFLYLVPLTLGKSAPLLFASAGGLLSEASGVINFALEAMMLSGAFAAVWAAHATGSPWAGLAAGACAGMAVGFLHAAASLWLRANQIVSSIALNLLAAGTTGLLLNQVFGVYGTSPEAPKLPGLAGGLVGELFHGMGVLVLFALVLAPAVSVFFRWTVWGLHVRACGESPEAATAAGLAVGRIRFFSVVAGGALAGAGGAFLSIGELSQFVEQITQGRGYLAVVALILGRWRPAGVWLAVLVFGFGEALSEWLAVRWTGLPSQIFLAFPYLVCLGALICFRGARWPPSALGKA